MARALFATSLFLILSVSTFGQPCPGTWSSEFPGGDFDGNVRASAVFNDGTGAALYAGGWFSRAGGVHARGVAKWTGAGWVPLGADFDGDINALVAHTDGSLYAAGVFSNVGATLTGRVARWNGSAWVSAGVTPMTSGIARAMISFPDSDGTSRLWVGGSFLTVAANFGFVARIDQNQWAFPGSSLNSSMGVNCFAIFTEGTTSRLFAGGTDNVYPPRGSVLRWSGSSWDAVGPAPSGVNGTVNAMGVFGDGSGVQMYVAGDFTMAAGQPANHIARWNGTAWSPVGTGIDHTVYSLAGFDPDGFGPLPFATFAGGSNVTSAGAPASSVVTWNGSTWSPFGTGSNETVYTLTPFELGNSLFMGGAYSSINAFSASRAAYYNNSSAWHAMQNPAPGNSPSDTVDCLAWFDDDGPGPHAARLYVGGDFRRAGAVSAHYLAIWDGTTWSALPSEVNNTVYALKAFDDGSGPALFAGGRFTVAGGAPALGVAKWNGSEWSQVGAGLNGPVYAFATYAPSGGSPSLFAGGGFPAQVGSTAPGVARLQSGSWVGVGSSGGLSSIIDIRAMATFDAGAGEKLYIVGQIHGSNPVMAWDGAAWTNAGVGISASAFIDCMAVYDDGQGAALYLGGSSVVNPVAGVTANIARFNGSTWTGLPNGPATQVNSLAVHDDGTGSQLYVGGYSSHLLDGQPTTHLVRWNGTAWSSVPGQTSPVNSSYITYLLPVDEDGPPPATLYVGGRFTSLGEVSAGNIGRLISCTCYANCDGSSLPPILNVNDFQCFLNRFAAQDPSANCDGSTLPPILNINDFQCFVNKFAVGCP